jgi:tRNA threonylcarbamoyladenosine biosynthesis protein TsaE
MGNIEIITDKAEETQKVGEFLADELLKDDFKRKKALVIGLEGELGSGKTTFIQGLAKGFGIKERITSPTFVIIKKYEIRNPDFKSGSRLKHRDTRYKIQDMSFYHIDCYRLTKSKDLIDLDFKEIITHPQNIIVIEWAERVKKILPKNTWWIKFEYLDADKRRIIL